MRRMILYDRFGNAVSEISPNDVIYCERYEQINGEHSLKIATTQVLEKGSRLIYEDGRSVWREYVVTGVDEEHAARSKVIGTYYCVCSVQPDLQGVTVSRMPGVQTPTTAALALDALLSTQSRWQRGTVTNTNTGGASMYDMSAWKALGVLVDNWGGELSTRFDVSALDGVTARYVDYYDQIGESTAKRRFDFGADLRSIKRIQDDAPFYCRVSPRGKGEQTDAGGYGRKITIEDVNNGKDWLEYAPMVDVAKLPDGNGGYQYPTLIIENSDCETPTELKTWAQSVLAETLTPKITYEIDAVQAAVEGVDIQGVSLGDHVQVVDRNFGVDGLRLDARITAMTVDELNERKITVTLGNVTETIAAQFQSLSTNVAQINNTLTVMSTAQYVDDLLGRINTEINATGGYTYIVPGNGVLTFDVAVADPLNPVEASQVVEIKGGTIRIANSKTAQGAWEWKTVFTSGHITGELVTAAQITTGYIGSNGDTFIDLDNHTVQLGNSNSNHITINNNEMLLKSAIGRYAILDGDGFTIHGISTSDIAALGFGTTYSGGSSDITTETAPYFTCGLRSANSRIGSYSVAVGLGAEATGHSSIALGSGCKASDRYGFATGMDSQAGEYSFAQGYEAKALGDFAFAAGGTSNASGDRSIAMGYQAEANSTDGVAIGRGAKSTATGCIALGWNYSGGYPFVFGNSANAYAQDLARIGMSGQMWTLGGYTQASDRRVKEHVDYISQEDAAAFVHALKPVEFIKDGKHHLGFYAQDVESGIWGELLVDEAEIDEKHDFAVKSLDYVGMIAPIVSHAQAMEKRIAELEQRIIELEAKIE